MAKRKKKYKIRRKNITKLIVILIAIVLLIYFGFIKDYEKEKLLKIGYQETDIVELREKLSSKEIKKIIEYEHLSFLSELIKSPNFKLEKLTTYIDYALTIKEDYLVEDVISIVNQNITMSYSSKLAKIINEEYFVLSRLDRYMAYEGEDTKEIVTYINANLDYEFYKEPKKTDTSKGNLLLVNKYYALEEDYFYGELVEMESEYDNKSGSKLNKDAYEAFKILVDKAESEGYHIRNNSAYRSYETQLGLYNSYKNQNGLEWADKWSARAGHSEHQTGLALDVGVKNEYVLGKFESSKEFTWMKENAHLYGFILRYPEGKEHITGYGYEPWHYRYVGESVATYIYEHDITFEEYYAYFVE